MSTTVDNLGENGVRYWEKTQYDTSPNQDGFDSARDLGHVRLNYSRLNTVAQLSEKDTVDFFKINVISTGKLRISLQDSTPNDNLLDLDEHYEALGLETPSDKRDAELLEEAKALEAAEEEEEKFLDLSKYEDYLAKFDTEPEEEEEQSGSDIAKTIEENLIKYEDTINELKAKNLNFKLYSITGLKETVLADNTAEKGSAEREAYEELLRGDYAPPEKGVYYIKIEKSEDFEDDDLFYSMQVQMGTEHDHEYMMKEIKSKDEDKTEHELKMTTSPMDLLDTSTAITAASYTGQQMANQSAASLLSYGYMSMENILGNGIGTTSTLFDYLS